MTSKSVVLSLLLLIVHLVVSPSAFAQVDPSTMFDTQIVWRDQRACGVNSLYVLLRLHGCDSDYSQLSSELFDASRGGYTSLANLRDVASRRGLDLEMGRTSPDVLHEMSKPVIAHIEPQEEGEWGHYVVVLDANEDTVRTMDGTTAIVMTRPWREFASLWSGHVLYPTRPPSQTRVWAAYALAALIGGGLAFTLISLTKRSVSARRLPNGLPTTAQ